VNSFNSPDHPGADVIDFAPGLAGTIALAGRQLSITDDLTSSGPGAEVAPRKSAFDARYSRMAAFCLSSV
jgi:hypothetical protein